MNEDDFEGSLVLEKLASLGLVDDFFDAIDSDDVGEMISLLREAGIDEETVQSIIRKISDT
jgi:hypothetical protein